MRNNDKIVYLILTLSIAFFIAGSWRVINAEHVGVYNLELITATTVLAVIVLRDPRVWLLAPAISLTTDPLVGQSGYQWSTAVAWLVIGIVVVSAYRWLKSQPIVAGLTVGLASSVWFYACTNFFVWAQGWYGPGISGLQASYIAGLPFFRTMLIGNLIIVPLVATLTIKVISPAAQRISITENRGAYA